MVKTSKSLFTKVNLRYKYYETPEKSSENLSWSAAAGNASYNRR